MTLRQVGALRRLDGLPMLQVCRDEGNHRMERTRPQVEAPVQPVMCEIGCATDDAIDELERLRSELEALKELKPQKVYAEKGVPCSEDEAESSIPEAVTPLALMDKEEFSDDLDEATKQRLEEIAGSMAASRNVESEEFSEGGSLFITLLARRGKLGFRVTATPGLLVYRTERSSWAEAAGLQRGDQLVKVSGVDAKFLTWQQLHRALRLRPLELTFFRGPGAGRSHLLEQIADALSGFRAWNLMKDDIPEVVSSPLEVPRLLGSSPDSDPGSPRSPRPIPIEGELDRVMVLKAVRLLGQQLEFASQEFQNDDEVVLEAISQDVSALRWASDRLRSSKAFVLKALRTSEKLQGKSAARVWHFASEELKKDRDVIMAAVRLDSLEIFPSADREIVELAVSQHGSLLSFAGDFLKADRDLALLAIRNDAWALQWVTDPKLRKDSELVMMALAANPEIFPFLVGAWREDQVKDVVGDQTETPLMTLLQGGAECLKDDKELAMAALQQNCEVFPFLSFNLKADKELVLHVLKEKGSLLKYASPLLQADKQVVLTAVRQNGCALLHASPMLRRDIQVVLQAVRQNHEIFPFLVSDLKAERNIAMAAVHGNGMLLSTVPKSLQLGIDLGVQLDRELVIAAVKQNPAALEHVDASLRYDRDFLLCSGI
eukprot:symbB.v1.2.034835.t1/scaffold4568.1/size37887/1